MKCHACGNQAALGSDIHSGVADDNGSGPPKLLASESERAEGCHIANGAQDTRNVTTHAAATGHAD